MSTLLISNHGRTLYLNENLRKKIKFQLLSMNLHKIHRVRSNSMDSIKGDKVRVNNTIEMKHRNESCKK
jgi:hypothetical protein